MIHKFKSLDNRKREKESNQYAPFLLCVMLYHRIQWGRKEVNQEAKEKGQPMLNKSWRTILELLKLAKRAEAKAGTITTTSSVLA